MTVTLSWMRADALRMPSQSWRMDCGATMGELMIASTRSRRCFFRRLALLVKSGPATFFGCSWWRAVATKGAI